MKLIKSRYLVLAVTLFILYLNGFQLVFAQSNIDYCNSVQNKVGLIKYPMGTMAVSSTNSGEIADAMTLVPRIYPCINEVVNRGDNNDWRANISGDPSLLKIKYLADKPCGASTAEITVTPHMSVCKITFSDKVNKRFVVFDFSKYRVDNWAKLYKWTKRSVTRIDNRTIQAAVSEPGKEGVYYTIKFSQPCISSGIIDSTGAVREGADRISGTMLGMYAQFDASSVTISISESFVSINQTLNFLKTESSDFELAHKYCREEWGKVINVFGLEGSENNKRMAYTALYTLLVNLIDGSEGVYKKYYPRPISLASSAYWQFIEGFQSCSWDNYRAAYPFLMLGYPEVMSDVVNTYLARYQRNGCMDGNICLFTGPTGGHLSLRFNPVIVEEALQSGIKADYSNLYKALKDNFSNPEYFPLSLTTLGYVTQPVSGGKACSETLEWTTGLHSLAMLAKAFDDPAEMSRDYKLSFSYKNIWDRENLIFRVKNPDGSWGKIDNEKWTWDPNPQGLFEGTNKDWMFSVPHDPYGLINLPGQEQFVNRVINYCTNDSWFNDYQYHYPYLLYYADAANAAQKIIRKTWVPMFTAGVMYEGVSPKPPYNGWKSHYTSNAGWLICCMTGLYPMQSPAGQYIITSPSLTKTVINIGKKNITVQALNNSEDNIYIKEIKVNGKVYPSYLIPSEKLVSGVIIDLLMSSDPGCKLGNLYLSSSNGFVRTAELVSESHLKCSIESAVTDAVTKVYCNTRPVQVLLNGKKSDSWSFDAQNNICTIPSEDTATLEVFLR